MTFKGWVVAEKFVYRGDPVIEGSFVVMKRDEVRSSFPCILNILRYLLSNRDGSFYWGGVGKSDLLEAVMEGID